MIQKKLLLKIGTLIMNLTCYLLNLQQNLSNYTNTHYESIIIKRQCQQEWQHVRGTIGDSPSIGEEWQGMNFIR